MTTALRSGSVTTSSVTRYRPSRSVLTWVNRRLRSSGRATTVRMSVDCRSVVVPSLTVRSSDRTLGVDRSG